MNAKFGLQDLKTGDIVKNRNKEVGVVIAQKKAIIYQEAGIDYYDAFTDDLLYKDDQRGRDIVVVYRREDFPIPIEFTSYDLGDRIFDRDKNMEC